MNKRKVYRVEHKTIAHPLSTKINLGPYYGKHYTGPRCEKLLDLLKKMEESPSVKDRLSRPAPASFLMKRPGIYEDPFLRDIAMPCWVNPQVNNPVSNFFVFSFCDLVQYRAWFDTEEFPEIKPALENAGFVLRKYLIKDPVYVGKAQTVFRLQNIIAKGEELPF